MTFHAAREALPPSQAHSRGTDQSNLPNSPCKGVCLSKTHRSAHLDSHCCNGSFQGEQLFPGSLQTPEPIAESGLLLAWLRKRKKKPSPEHRVEKGLSHVGRKNNSCSPLIKSLVESWWGQNSAPAQMNSYVWLLQLWLTAHLETHLRGFMATPRVLQSHKTLK